MAPIALLPSLEEGIPYYMFLLKISSLLIHGVFSWVKGGVINIWLVKPFETVMVNKGCTNKIELNWIEEEQREKGEEEDKE